MYPYESGTGSLSGTVTASGHRRSPGSRALPRRRRRPRLRVLAQSPTRTARTSSRSPRGHVLLPDVRPGLRAPDGFVAIADGENVVNDVVLLPTDRPSRASSPTANATLGDTGLRAPEQRRLRDHERLDQARRHLPHRGARSGDYTLHLGGPGAGYEDKVVQFTLEGARPPPPPIVLDAATTAEIEESSRRRIFLLLASEGVEGLCVAPVDDSGAVGESS